MQAVAPQREKTTVELGEACVGYSVDRDDDQCAVVYAREGDETRTIFADPPAGEDRIPDQAEVGYRGREYDAELCFRYQEGRGPVPGLCWEVTSPA